MTLTQDDKVWIKGAITEGVVDALNEIVLPRFDEHDKRFDEHDRRFDALEADVRVLKEDVRVLKDDVRILKDDMTQVKFTLDRLDGRVEALENDIKELYFMQTGRENISLTDPTFAKLPLEKKLLVFNTELLGMAKQAGITLPRS